MPVQQADRIEEATAFINSCIHHAAEKYELTHKEFLHIIDTIRGAER